MLQIMNHFSGLFVCVISALQLVVKPQEVSVDLDNEAITLQMSFIREHLISQVVYTELDMFANSCIPHHRAIHR